MAKAQMTKSNHGISRNVVAVGVGAAAAAAAAVGAYWFYGSKDAAKHRKSARSWMLKARADVLSGVEIAIEKAGHIEKETYMNIVEDVLSRYSKIAGVTSAEMKEMTRDMKNAWQHMQQIYKKGGAVKVAKKMSKKVSKKTR